MKDFSSPDKFIVWGFYAMIAAALQRRVWLGSNQKMLHPNMYIVLVGPPACGKGLVIGEISNIYRHDRMKKVADLEERKNDIANLGAGDLVNKDGFDLMQNMLIPIAPNATTYEALCRTIGKSTRHMYVETSEVDVTGKFKRKVIAHSSIMFLLEELGSLIRKHHDDIHTFLQETYDCKDPYEYRTKNQGVDYIRRPCVNLFAGTTPEFLRRIFSSQLVNEGFSSRTVFVVALTPRFRRYDTPQFTEDQLAAYKEIVEHVRKISTIQGLVKFTPEALEYNKYWYEQTYGIRVPNPHPKLIPYYGRINITHMKLAMAMHFSNSTEMVIGKDICEKALELLQETEIPMHMAINIENKNPLSEATESIYKYISAKDWTSLKELKVQFWDSMPDPTEDLPKIIQFLKDSGKIQEGDKANTYKAVKE